MDGVAAASGRGFAAARMPRKLRGGGRRYEPRCSPQNNWRPISRVFGICIAVREKLREQAGFDRELCRPSLAVWPQIRPPARRYQVSVGWIPSLRKRWLSYEDFHRRREIWTSSNFARMRLH